MYGSVCLGVFEGVFGGVCMLGVCVCVCVCVRMFGSMCVFGGVIMLGCVCVCVCMFGCMCVFGGVSMFGG